MCIYIHTYIYIYIYTHIYIYICLEFDMEQSVVHLVTSIIKMKKGLGQCFLFSVCSFSF